MSTELTSAAPLLNLLAFTAIIGAMLAVARWLDRRIGRGEYTPLPLSGVVARSIAPSPEAERAGRPWPGGRTLPFLGRAAKVAPSSLAIDERRALLALFGAAVAVGALFLERLPGTIAGAELGVIGTALQILSGQGPGLFGFDDAGQPALGAYLVAAAFQLFGSGLFVERALAGLLAACAVIPLYALLRRIVAPLPATLAALLFVGSQPFLLLARGGWAVGPLLTGTAVAAWALCRAVERRCMRDRALFGATLGILCYSYPFGRLVALALLVALGSKLWAERSRQEVGARRGAAIGIVVAALVCLLLVAPQLIAAVRDLGRGAMASAPASGGDGLAVIGQAWRGLRHLLLPGATATVPVDLAGGRWPDPLSVLLALGGIGVALRQRRGIGLWWALLVIPVALLLIAGDADSRAGLSAITIVPLTAFMAIGLETFLRRPALQTRTAQAALLGWTLILVALNIGTYASWNGGAEAIAARQPALPASEFWLWRDYQQSRLDIQEDLLKLREYRDLPSSTITGRLAAARDANAEVSVVQRVPPRTDLGSEVRAFGTAGKSPGQLDEPRAVAVDPDGSFYVADAGRGMLVKFDADGAFVAEWPTTAQFAQPWSILLLPDKSLLVLDWQTSRLARYDRAGVFLGTVLPLGQESIARGMALGLDGQVYIAQTAANRVVALPVGALTNEAARIVALAGAATTQQPTSAVANGRGFLFVYEPDGKRLRGFTADGRLRFTRAAPATDTTNAGGLLALPDGRLALADVTERTVLIYGADGELIGSFPVAGLPQGLALTPGGQIAVVDREGGQIRLYQLTAP